jgi:adenine-specific DNA-methyltransferase
VAKRGPKPRKPRVLKVRKKPDTRTPRTYKHEQDRLLLRPDVGLQPQFKPKKPAKTYRYDLSLDPALSWDVNADRERGEALIAQCSRRDPVSRRRARASLAA